jgi:putative sigma-54 modulation protein
MNVTITGRHMEVTEALKDHVRGGIDKVLSHFDKVIDADVVLAVEKRHHIAEVNLHANGLRIHGKEKSEDMYASVDAVIEKVERQVRKHKDRINRHQPRKSESLPDYNYAIIAPAAENGQSSDVAADSKHEVVNREKLSMRPMSVDEALMQLELIEAKFIVFSNTETSQINVLYEREDGQYGLIEPLY